ncbi:MAG: hypothetical protein RL685_4811 [Pseudomonadota bacterium]
MGRVSPRKSLSSKPAGLTAAYASMRQPLRWRSICMLCRTPERRAHGAHPWTSVAAKWDACRASGHEIYKHRQINYRLHWERDQPGRLSSRSRTSPRGFACAGSSISSNWIAGNWIFGNEIQEPEFQDQALQRPGSQLAGPFGGDDAEPAPECCEKPRTGAAGQRRADVGDDASLKRRCIRETTMHL